ncbi:MAG: 50S ribosomal protein L21 [Clostridiales bacterium]|nr:MAG: 50S ribosomal protein L21 [Clostridiales bacterium]
MYAIIETGGKQYRVTEGDVVFVEKLAVEAGDKVDFDKVVAVSNDAGLTVGTPYVEGAKVAASVVKNGKAKKVLMMRYKPKKDVRVKRGHRQPYTQVKIESISI